MSIVAKRSPISATAEHLFEHIVWDFKCMYLNHIKQHVISVI